jgi:hypothetical protein
MSEFPDLLLIYYNYEPKHKDAFVKSLLSDLHIVIGSETKLILYPMPNAENFTDTLVRATVHAERHFNQYSQTMDTDRTTYQIFESFSPTEITSLQGYLFKMYYKRTTETSNPNKLSDKLYIGMPLNEIVQLLGEPNGVNPGTEMLENGPSGIVVVSDEERLELSKTIYCLWKRPEGMYALVIVNNKLERIHMKP